MCAKFQVKIRLGLDYRYGVILTHHPIHVKEATKKPVRNRFKD